MYILRNNRNITKLNSFLNHHDSDGNEYWDQSEWLDGPIFMSNRLHSDSELMPV